MFVEGSDRDHQEEVIDLIIKMPSFNLSVLMTLVLGLLSLSSLSEAEYRYHVCSNTTSFTPNSTYEFNLKLLLSSLTSNATRELGFYNTTAGSQDPNAAVYGSFLCRADLTSDACQDCVATAARETVKEYCPLRKVTIIWYDDCMLRYSNMSFFGNMDKAPSVYLWNVGNITDPNRFNQVLVDTITGLVSVAANAASGAKKFATKEANITGFQELYILVQCTPDLSSTACHWCLLGAITLLPDCCEWKQGGRVLYPSCNVRYEMYPFYTIVAAPPLPLLLPPPPPARSQGGRSRFSPSIIIVTSILALVAVSVLLVAFYCFARRTSVRDEYNTAPSQENAFYCFARRRSVRDEYSNSTAPSQENVGNDTNSVESLQFDLGTIETATSKFSDNNKLGEGGFGVVFKGTLANGHEIAVKRLSKSSKQGVQEFKNEVALVAKLQHRNLVRLLGFCLEGEETILVYEYVPNKSLDYFLFESEKREQLDWSSRCMITEGIARGILYLHEDSRLRVIHRDLKASNILLDGNMNPKISDFGMARMFGVEDQTQGNTKRIVGTYGYMAPEYAMEGLYSVKSDVFSFGILLLEIITGRRNFLGFHPTNHAPTLIGYAWQLWNETKGLELMDPLLKDSCSPNEFLRNIHIGLLCVQEDANKRPTMSSVVLMLKSETISLSRPEKPAFFTGRSTDHHDQENAHNCSANGLTISNDLPR
ncbi:cysteine-rich receptor-like protein kinase 25 isoform X2 [Prunus avium]|uniref:non-specific serine/threonine protein kinase n=1 Tax=Prunus avium TaxID=42229 RepID=A0A6P5SU22_PRUAV|nr:cysteine-rich receptor-like protein kinase 25 isoform X2 [Prunus avium]